uniref:hypothetical protein RF1 n=1 Tax=Pseudocodon convolvulaceus TaxID=1392590 RepID=UPI001BEDBC4A|nr:hypothetical protein RF1 [Pseudocodon convolvulaceus]YP_010268518.1 hypothetical protein RF1 [Pseudocodon convolvulaceus]QTZ17979.1 hypothetical chloroplast RF19 [Pseudocodon vinciflorus]QTZ17995.1 hypothetical chloroplast RF19 [Pseudocodon vinciflorus]UIG86710.1 hypothetical protein RF1 [Pseudocodon convolvulaceus]UIG86726.1 hypothetical protein RF1 [Pseudocodon convolvulaceus]
MSTLFQSLGSFCIKLINSAAGVGLYYGLLTTFANIRPSYLFLILEETEKRVAVITGLIMGQLVRFISIYNAPLHRLLGRPHTITLLFVPYLLVYFLFDYFYYPHRTRSNFEFFLNSFIFQLANQFLLPNPTLARLINIYLFRCNNKMVFLTSSFVGWLIGQICFLLFMKRLFAWIRKYIFSRSKKDLVSKLNKYITKYLGAEFFSLLAQFQYRVSELNKYIKSELNKYSNKIYQYLVKCLGSEIEALVANFQWLVAEFQYLLFIDLMRNMGRVFNIVLYMTCLTFLGRMPVPILTFQMNKLNKINQVPVMRGPEIESQRQLAYTSEEEQEEEEEQEAQDKQKQEGFKLDFPFRWWALDPDEEPDQEEHRPFERNLAILFFDSSRWNRPSRYLTNCNFPGGAVKTEASQYFFDTCRSDGKERIAFTYPPSFSIFKEMMKRKRPSSIVETPSFDELDKDWLDKNKQKKNNLNNEFRKRIEALDTGFIFRDILEKRTRVCTEKTQKTCLPKKYDPFLNGPGRGSIKRLNNRYVRPEVETYRHESETNAMLKGTKTKRDVMRRIRKQQSRNNAIRQFILRKRKNIDEIRKLISGKIKAIRKFLFRKRINNAIRKSRKRKNNAIRKSRGRKNNATFKSRKRKNIDEIRKLISGKIKAIRKSRGRKNNATSKSRGRKNNAIRKSRGRMKIGNSQSKMIQSLVLNRIYETLIPGFLYDSPNYGQGLLAILKRKTQKLRAEKKLDSNPLEKLFSNPVKKGWERIGREQLKNKRIGTKNKYFRGKGLFHREIVHRVPRWIYKIFIELIGQMTEHTDVARDEYEVKSAKFKQVLFFSPPVKREKEITKGTQDKKTDIAETHTQDKKTDIAETHTQDKKTDIAETDTQDKKTDIAETDTQDKKTDIAETHTQDKKTDIAETDTQDKKTDIAETDTQDEKTDIAETDTQDEKTDIEKMNVPQIAVLNALNNREHEKEDLYRYQYTSAGKFQHGIIKGPMRAQRRKTFIVRKIESRPRSPLFFRFVKSRRSIYFGFMNPKVLVLKIQNLMPRLGFVSKRIQNLMHRLVFGSKKIQNLMHGLVFVSKRIQNLMHRLVFGNKRSKKLMHRLGFRSKKRGGLFTLNERNKEQTKTDEKDEKERKERKERKAGKERKERKERKARKAGKERKAGKARKERKAGKERKERKERKAGKERKERKPRAQFLIKLLHVQPEIETEVSSFEKHLIEWQAAEDWDELIEYGLGVRACIVLFNSVFRKYIALPSVIIAKTIGRFLLLQETEWSEDFEDWKKEIHAICTYDGATLSDREFPENWVEEGLQVKITSPFYLKPWRTEADREVENPESVYIRAVWGLSEYPMGEILYDPSFEIFWMPILKELNDIREKLFRKKEMKETDFVVLREFLNKFKKKIKEKIVRVRKGSKKSIQWLIKTVLVLKRKIEKFKRKIEKFKRKIEKFKRKIEKLFKKIKKTRKENRILRGVHESSETKKEKDSIISNEIIHESFSQIQSTASEEKIQNLINRISTINNELEIIRKEKKNVESPKNIWTIVKRRNVRLLSKLHYFLKLFIEKIYKIYLDIFLWIINICRINFTKKFFEKDIYNTETNEKRITFRRASPPFLKIFSSLPDFSSLSQAYVFYKLSQTQVSDKLRSVLQYRGTSFFVKTAIKDSFERQGIFHSELKHKKLRNFGTNPWKNWLRGHYQYNFSQIRWSLLIPQKWRNAINQRHTPQNKDFNKGDSYEKDQLLHYKKQNDSEVYSLTNQKNKLEKNYRYDLLAYKFICPETKKDSYISKFPFQVNKKQEISYNYTTQKDKLFAIAIPEEIFIKHYLDKNYLTSFVNRKSLDFDCKILKFEAEAWMKIDPNHNTNTKVGTNNSQIIENRGLIYDILSSDPEIQELNHKKHKKSFFDWKKHKKSFFDWMGMNEELFTKAPEKDWFVREVMLPLQTYKMNPWIRPIKLLLSNFKGKEIVSEEEELVRKEKGTVRKEEENVRKAKGTVRKGNELVRKANEISREEEELVRKGKDIFRKEKEIVRKEEELVSKAKELVSKAKENVRKGTENVTKANEISREEKELVRKGKDIVKENVRTGKENVSQDEEEENVRTGKENGSKNIEEVITEHYEKRFMKKEKQYRRRNPPEEKFRFVLFEKEYANPELAFLKLSMLKKPLRFYSLWKNIRNAERKKTLGLLYCAIGNLTPLNLGISGFVSVAYNNWWLRGVFRLNPHPNLSITNQEQFLMYQAISISLVHKSKQQTNQRYGNQKSVDKDNLDLLVPEMIFSSRRRRELRILNSFNFHFRNGVDRNPVFCKENNIKSWGQFLDESKHLDRDQNELIKLKLFLWPNYRLEDLACMNRYWFDTNNGSRFSMLRIYMYPRFKIRSW